MKTKPTPKCTWFLIAIMVGYMLISCDREEDRSGFSIEFSDGTKITQDDISYYDSSVCILFLNRELSIIAGTEDSPSKRIYTEFIVSVNNEVLYEGIFYPFGLTSFVPPSNTYITTKTYPVFESSILQFSSTLTHPNDPRLINFMKTRNFLRKGIACRIDSIEKSSDNDTTMLFTFTYKNYDQIDYYVPDPVKMGDMYFNGISQITLNNLENDKTLYSRSVYAITSDWRFTIDDLSMLERNSELTCTFITPCSDTIEEGVYDCWFRLNNYILPITISLDQPNGRVWVGHFRISVDNVVIE